MLSKNVIHWFALMPSFLMVMGSYIYHKCFREVYSFTEVDKFILINIWVYVSVIGIILGCNNLDKATDNMIKMKSFKNIGTILLALSLGFLSLDELEGAPFISFVFRYFLFGSLFYSIQVNKHILENEKI